MGNASQGVVAIHQPEHLPWLGFLDKASRADRFVLLDHVQYRRRYFQNRNRIRSPEGPLWLTVPVRNKGRYEQPICEVEIDNQTEPRWRERCMKSLRHCYAQAPHFTEHAGFFEELYRRTWDKLLDLNEAILRYLFEAFSVQAEVERSSSLRAVSAPSAGIGHPVPHQKGDLILEICRRLGATTYLSGISGREYLDVGKFREAGIEVRFQEFHHPIYPQLREPFLPCMSAVDLLFNHGPQSARILRGEGVATLEKLFV